MIKELLPLLFHQVTYQTLNSTQFLISFHAEKPVWFGVIAVLSLISLSKAYRNNGGVDSISHHALANKLLEPLIYVITLYCVLQTMQE